MITIRPTDRAFPDSPDAGDSVCLCSRCGGLIADVAIRAWSAHADGVVEYRYHPQCLAHDLGFSDSDDGPLEDL